MEADLARGNHRCSAHALKGAVSRIHEAKIDTIRHDLCLYPFTETCCYWQPGDVETKAVTAMKRIFPSCPFPVKKAEERTSTARIEIDGSRMSNSRPIKKFMRYAVVDGNRRAVASKTHHRP